MGKNIRIAAVMAFAALLAFLLLRLVDTKPVCNREAALPWLVCP